MPRRKKIAAAASQDTGSHEPASVQQTDSSTAVAEPTDREPTQASLERPAYIDGPPTNAAGEVVTPDANRADAEQPKHWGNPYKATFTCPTKRFELGENRRFKQMVFTFAENPGAEVTQKLKDAGFKYRAAEKAWTSQVTPAVRELATKLAHELAGSEQSNGMVR